MRGLLYCTKIAHPLARRICLTAHLTLVYRLVKGEKTLYGACHITWGERALLLEYPEEDAEEDSGIDHPAHGVAAGEEAEVGIGGKHTIEPEEAHTADKHHAHQCGSERMPQSTQET